MGLFILSTHIPIYSCLFSVCTGTGFHCPNGICISRDKICDGNNDCGDNSDETQDCGMSVCLSVLRECMRACVCVWGGRRGSRIFERGGSRRGYRIFHKHPPPWTFTLARVTSSDLRKFEKHPHSWTFTSTPLGHCLRDVIRHQKN